MFQDNELQSKPAHPDTLFDLSRINQKYTGINNIRKNTCTATHTIYPLNHLRTLIHELQGEDSGKVPSHIVRYLVDLNGSIWFAKEGVAGRYAPPHYKMTGAPRGDLAHCLSAGNIEFSEDYNFIIKINHKSGDFKPAFQSLQWALGVLLAQTALPINLAPQLIIEELESQAGYSVHHQIELTDLQVWFTSNQECFTRYFAEKKVPGFHVQSQETMLSYSTPTTDRFASLGARRPLEARGSFEHAGKLSFDDEDVQAIDPTLDSSLFAGMGISSPPPSASTFSTPETPLRQVRRKIGLFDSFELSPSYEVDQGDLKENQLNFN